jgi:Protein of unknown function (DUF3579)
VFFAMFKILAHMPMTTVTRESGFDAEMSALLTVFPMKRLGGFDVKGYNFAVQQTTISARHVAFPHVVFPILMPFDTQILVDRPASPTRPSHLAPTHTQTQMRIIIQGVMLNGRVFRPSDWAERLCGIMSTFGRDQQMRYSASVRPIMLDGVRCVMVDQALAETEPRAYRFLLDFAKDNELNVIDPTAPLPEDVCPVPGRSLDELVAG